MLVLDQLKRSDPHLRVLSIAVLCGMAVLLGGVWYLQVLSGKRYKIDAQEQYTRTIRIPAVRGRILDRNRQALADSRPSYNINLYLEELRPAFRFSYTNDVRKAFVAAHPKVRMTPRITSPLEEEARYRVVSNYLFQVSSYLNNPQILIPKSFHEHYTNLRSIPLPLLTDLSPAQVAQFLERSTHLSSLELEARPMRVYRQGETAAHLLGYVRLDASPTDDDLYELPMADYAGRTGLEARYDAELRGEAGIKAVRVNSMQYRLSEEVFAEAVPGKNLILTIDLEIQKAADQALKGAGPDTRGSAVVMDVHTGEILALSSAPSYDPNVFLNPIPYNVYTNLANPELKRFFNRATYGTPQPGSIFKIIVALACLEAGLDPHQKIECLGYYRLTPRSRLIHDTAGRGFFDFREAFYKSSNAYFITNGLKAGVERIVEMGRRFGLGERTGLATGQEASGYFPQAGALRSRDGSRWQDGDTANLCIGQGDITVTPLQMAVMTAAIANGGKILQPQILSQIEPQQSADESQVVRFAHSQARHQLNLHPSHLEILRTAMLDDVEHRDAYGRLDGTGKNAAVPNFRVSGKTGTAERVGATDTWFVSYAPYENPRYAVVVMVEDGGSGGGTCAPLARQIYEALVKREKAASARQAARF